jgi:hypothetical protein
MIEAAYSDKSKIVNILTGAFAGNKSVNYIIKQDKNKRQRIRKLMEYSFDTCFLFGKVFLSDDKTACALILFPDLKKTTWKSVMLNINLMFSSTGARNIFKTIKREAKIKDIHPEGLIYYLWFIGVDPNEQHKGTGSRLLQEIIQDGLSSNRKICLETSTLKNIPWYQQYGFTVYRQLDFGYKLYCMKKE